VRANPSLLSIAPKLQPLKKRVEVPPPPRLSRTTELVTHPAVNPEFEEAVRSAPGTLVSIVTAEMAVVVQGIPSSVSV
jgi:hypothetical protein